MWLQGELIFNYLCRVSAVNNSQLVFQSGSNPLISTFEPFLALPSPYPILHVGRGDTSETYYHWLRCLKTNTVTLFNR